jgi:hypothetical protein
MFKIFSTDICGKKYIKRGVWRVAVCLSYISDARFRKVNAGIINERNYTTTLYVRTFATCALKTFLWHKYAHLSAEFPLLPLSTSINILCLLHAFASKTFACATFVMK